MSGPPFWVSVPSALLTPTIAVVAAGVAYRQWVIARNRLKLDLFDRRFAVYEATRRLLQAVLAHRKPSDQDLMQFMVETRAAKWLLDARTAAYLWKELHGKAVELKILHDEMADLPVGEKRNDNIAQQRECTDWLYAQFEVMEKKFDPFLALGH